MKTKEVWATLKFVGIYVAICIALILLACLIVTLKDIWTESGRDLLQYDLLDTLKIVGGIELFFTVIFLGYGFLEYSHRDFKSTAYEYARILYWICIGICAFKVVTWYIGYLRYTDGYFLIIKLAVPAYIAYHLYNKYIEHELDSEKEKKIADSYFSEAIKEKNKLKALELIDTAINIYEDKEYYQERGQILTELEFYIDAIKDFDWVINNETDQTHVYYQRALCKHRIGDLYGAKIDYKTAIENSKRDTSENKQINLNAKKMHETWRDGTHVYESHYRFFEDDYQRIFKNDRVNFLFDEFESAASKIRD